MFIQRVSTSKWGALPRAASPTHFKHFNALKHSWIVTVLCLFWQMLATGSLIAGETTAKVVDPGPQITATGASRDFGGLYTQQRLSNALANVQKYDWARKLCNEAVARAKPWIEKSDRELWAIVPGQNLPRCIDVTYNRLQTPQKLPDCPECGEKILAYGAYPFILDFEHKPWKLTCPSCGAVFPTNDFGKYYASAIDEHGLFNPAKGDRSLLFNSAHPDPKDPLHLYGVDDGFGWVDPKTHHVYKFIAYYAWKYWRHIYYDGITNLANAYLYTGDKIYAHKAAILLDRIADVYPGMDWAPYYKMGWYHSDANRGVGKIEGAIWETGVVTTLANAYDKILSGTLEDSSLYAFLKHQSERFELPTPKGTRDDFVKNVDDNILRCAYQAVLADRIRGNEGMNQESVAACALALNTQPETNQWLDWLFSPTGGAIPGLIVSQLDRDGLPPEGAPQYAVLWGAHFADIADWLNEYPQYSKHNIYREFPQFRAAFSAPYRMAALGFATPNIGDTGSCGEIAAVGLNVNRMAERFEYTHDPAIAVAVYRANHNSGKGLGRNILSRDPDRIGDEIQKIGQTAGPRPEGGDLLSGFGLATLENGAGKNGIALACNFGRTINHGHLDQLNFDLLAFGNWLAPDQGYPEMATNWPSRLEWTRNTLSHNTVVVDQKPQEENWGGHVRLFEQQPGFGVFQIDAPAAYPQCTRYQRTMLLIRTPDNNSYVVDIFRVAGGRDHLYSFHGPPGDVSARGLNLVSQPDGTYAGENILLAAHADGFPLGYSYLYNIRRDSHPSSQFQLDWKAASGYRAITAKDDVHLHFFGLTDCDDVALADGDPPQNKVGNPRRLKYLLLHRTGANLTSMFVSVLEPYRHTPFIRTVSRLDTYKNQIAIRIEFTDGHVDDVLCNFSDRPIRIPSGPKLMGAIGFVRQDGQNVIQMNLVDGSNLSYWNTDLTAQAELTGHVVAMNKELSGGGWILVNSQLPTDGSLIGRKIMIANHNERDSCYTIRSISDQGKFSKVDCGPLSFVRGYQGPTVLLRGQEMPKDYSQGYLYDFHEGANFRIPMSAAWKGRAQ
jgi:hypothetical protein